MYCSEGFSFLTGYSSSEAIGRNCRFLQSPTGTVTAGTSREHLGPDDGQKLIALKKKVEQREEEQVELVNFRKGGSRFRNVLTTVPVRLGDNGQGETARYCVGFLADRSRSWS